MLRYFGRSPRTLAPTCSKQHFPRDFANVASSFSWLSRLPSPCSTRLFLLVGVGFFCSLPLLPCLLIRLHPHSHKRFGHRLPRSLHQRCFVPGLHLLTICHLLISTFLTTHDASTPPIIAFWANACGQYRTYPLTTTFGFYQNVDSS